MIKDTLHSFSQMPAIQNLLKKAGITPPPELQRTVCAWPDSFLRDRDIILGGSGIILPTVGESLFRVGSSLFLGPEVNDAPFKAIDHYKMQALDNVEMIKKSHGVVYDTSSISSIKQLRMLYDFFHTILAYLSPNTPIVIISRIPEEEGSIELTTVNQSIVGFTKSLAKELGRSGSTVNLLQVPHSQEAEQRLGAVTQFFLSQYSAFITGQVLPISTIAKISSQTELSGSLAGKTALVTGAVGGIGESTVKALAEEGVHVICLDHEDHVTALKNLAKKVDGTAIPCTLIGQQSWTKLEAEIKSSIGGLDIVIHNAGITRDRTLKRMSESSWDQVMDINLLAPYHMTLSMLKAGIIRDYGRIICLSSISGLAGNFGQTNYTSTKAGLIGFVRSLGQELAPQGITANAICPGFIETKMTSSVPALTKLMARKLAAMQQSGLPSDIANAITFLSSEASQGITGQAIRVCGGHLMG